MTLRPVTPQDGPFLLGVYASTRAGELAAVPWTDAQKAAFVAHQFSAQSRHYAGNYAGMSSDVICVGGVPAGRLLVARRDADIRIVDITLLPEFRGAGAGTGLLRALMDEASAAEKLLSIHVEVHNPAMRLYERLGFAPAGENGPYMRMERKP